MLKVGKPGRRQVCSNGKLQVLNPVSRRECDVEGLIRVFREALHADR